MALIPYITAGDPDLPTTAEALKVLDSCGSDIIELGLPYSDPLAVDLSNRPGRPFWPMARPEKKRAGPARPSTVAGWAGTAQKERAVLGQGC